MTTFVVVRSDSCRSHDCYTLVVGLYLCFLVLHNFTVIMLLSVDFKDLLIAYSVSREEHAQKFQCLFSFVSVRVMSLLRVDMNFFAFEQILEQS